MAANVWRLIKSTRRIGPMWILQYGIWNSPSTRGTSKGLNRRFTVAYEEFFHDKSMAIEAMEEKSNR